MPRKKAPISLAAASAGLGYPSFLGAVAQRLLVHKTDSVPVQFLRYGVVGGIAFIVDFSSLVILTSTAHVHYLWSAAIAFVFGLTTNYTLSVVWVFGSRTIFNKYAEFGVFAWIGIVGLGLNELFMWLFTGKWGVHYTTGKLMSTLLVFLWNFVSRRLLLFRSQ